MLKIMICCFQNLIINSGRSRVTGLIEDLISFIIFLKLIDLCG